jgi:hypothetical protein
LQSAEQALKQPVLAWTLGENSKKRAMKARKKRRKDTIMIDCGLETEFEGCSVGILLPN